MTVSRDPGHWVSEDFKQRMTSSDWKMLLMNGEDTVNFKGRVRQLVGDHIGAGVYEISKKPLDE